MDFAIIDELRDILSERTRVKAMSEWSEIQKESQAPVFNYRLDHVNRVVELVEYLSNGTNADRDILIMAAWLHDIAKPGIGGVENHGAKSANEAGRILKGLGVEESTIVAVKDAIRKHVGLTPQDDLTSIEAQILWEADKLVKIGAVGIIHFVLNAVRIHPGLDSRDMLKSVTEFLPLAEKIKNSMRTNKAKELAKGRYENLKIFRDNLQNELQGVDYSE